MAEPKEVHIVIGGMVLTEGQSMAVCVAISDFLMQLGDAEFRYGLGHELADAYKARLSEVMKQIVYDAR